MAADMQSGLKPSTQIQPLVATDTREPTESITVDAISSIDDSDAKVAS